MTSTPTGARQNNDPSRTTQLRIPPEPRTGGGRHPKKALPRYDYAHYSRLAGPLTLPDPSRPYSVQYRSLLSQEPHRLRAALLLGAAPLVSLGLFAWLMQPEHWTQRDPHLKNDTLLILDIVMLVSIGLIELFRTMNVLSNAHATLVARDPVPVVPEPCEQQCHGQRRRPRTGPAGVVAVHPLPLGRRTRPGESILTHPDVERRRATSSGRIVKYLLGVGSCAPYSDA